MSAASFGIAKAEQAIAVPGESIDAVSLGQLGYHMLKTRSDLRDHLSKVDHAHPQLPRDTLHLSDVRQANAFVRVDDLERSARRALGHNGPFLRPPNEFGKPSSTQSRWHQLTPTRQTGTQSSALWRSCHSREATRALAAVVLKRDNSA